MRRAFRIRTRNGKVRESTFHVVFRQSVLAEQPRRAADFPLRSAPSTWRTRSSTPIFGSGGPRPSQTLPYASQTHTITIARASLHKASFFATFVLPSHAVVTTRGRPSELILVCFQGTLRVHESRFSSRGCAPHPADGRGPAGRDSTHGGGGGAAISRGDFACPV